MNHVPFIVKVDRFIRLGRRILVNVQQISVLTIEVRRPLTSCPARMPRQNMISQFKLERIAS